MREGIYQELLGMPSETIDPDHYQLLGVEPGPVDPHVLEGRMAGLFNRLAEVRSADPELVACLSREIKRAGATLADEGARKEYDRNRPLRRVRDLQFYVRRMMSTENFISAANQEVLVRNMLGLGLSRDTAIALISESVNRLGGSREILPDVGEPEIRIAEFDLCEIMADYAKERVLTYDPPPLAPSPSRLVHRSPARIIPPAITEKRRSDMTHSKLNRKIAALEQENTRLSQDPGADSSAARRHLRCLFAGLLVALAFIGGGVTADLSPGTLDTMHTLIAEIPSNTMAWLGTAEGMASVSGGLGVLIIFVVALSGLRTGLAFLPPTAALMVAAWAFGVIPVGNDRVLEGRVATLQDSLFAERTRAHHAFTQIEIARDASAGHIRERDGHIALLHQEIRDRDLSIEEFRRLMAFKDDVIRKREREIRRYLAQMTKVTDELAVVSSDHKAVRSALEDRDATLSALVRERNELEQDLRDLRSEATRLQD